MITRLEIDGFKSFDKFKVDLTPFVVVAGINGAGKSNLFDAIMLLAKLAEKDIRSAFSEQRGEAYELFSQDAEGSFGHEMNFAVEVLVDKKIKDSWGGEADLKYTRLRYELRLERKKDERGIERIFVISESLQPILLGQDPWYLTYLGRQNESWRPLFSGDVIPFIYTEPEIDFVSIRVEQSGHGRPRQLSSLQSTMLSGATNTEHAHALAVRSEMLNWKCLQLNAVELRKPSSKLSSSEHMGSDGANIASTLFRIKSTEPQIINRIAREMMRLNPAIKSLDVTEDDLKNSYVVTICMEDGREFTSNVLSEGTLRFLALSTLKHDPEHKGVICFEEPENGINPFRIGQMVSLLDDLSTDFKTEIVAEFPARQVLVNTHSPVFVGEVCKLERFENRGTVLFARMVNKISEGKKKQHTLITPVQLSEKVDLFRMGDHSKEALRVSQKELVEYLKSASFPHELEQLARP